MKKLVTMRHALESPDYFGKYLVGESWLAWRALLIALMGEELTEAERAIFCKFTGRASEPRQIVRAFWGIIGRRGGKTRAMAVLAAYIAVCVDHRATLAPGERGLLPVLAVSQQQAAQSLNYIAGIFDVVPAFRKMVLNRTADTVSLKSGVDIQVRPASYRSIRGITAVAAIADEVAYWMTENSVNPDEEILGALRPSLITTGGILVAISSPYAQRGELFKNYRKHFGADGDPRILVAKGSSLELNPSLPHEEIEEAYKDDPAKAAAEYGAEFRTDVERFVTNEVVDACTPNEIFERPITYGRQYRAFVDPSGGSIDSMTLAIAHREADDKVILDLVRERKAPFSPENVTEEFAAELRLWKIKTVVGDAYSGQWARESFQRHGISYQLSDFTKSEIYVAALPLLNSKRATLLDNQRLTSQLVGLERRTSRGGRDSIDHAPGGHDDLANACCGALVCAIHQPGPQPARLISFHHMGR